MVIGKMDPRSLTKFAIIFFLCQALPWAALSAAPENIGTEDYYLADQYYEQHELSQALIHFQKALEANPALVARFPKIQLKLALCLFHTRRYSEAIDTLQVPNSVIESVADYRDYFIAKAELALADTTAALKKLALFKTEYVASPLRISADSLLAEVYFQRKDWKKAAGYYKKQLKYRGFDKGEITGRLVTIYKKIGYSKSLENKAFALIRKYPFHPQSEMAYQEILRLYEKTAMPSTKLNQVFTFLSKTNRFDKIDTLLAQQTKLKGNTEQIRWLKISKLYREKKYWAALDASKKRREQFKTSRYKRHIDLNIARCYLRMGMKEKAIAAYDVFQKRYPNDAISPEVLWVIAWLSEEQGKFVEARDYYLRLIRTYPHYEFANEALFRIGLSHYREGNYTSARKQWELSQRRKGDDLWKSRLKYWLAKAWQQEANDSAYVANLDAISEKPFDSYYNMKAFLVTKNSGQIQVFVDSLLGNIHQAPLSYLPKYLQHFQRPLLVQEVFGEEYAQRELNQLARKLKQPGWELTFALGEMNEQLQNYGKAYRYYRKVYVENFSKSDWREWVFLFKYLYPLYFNGKVNEYAQKWNITPASIWAVMKKESAFEPQITSYANAYGLMQIIPPTANRLSENLGVSFDDVRRLFEPDFNIFLGSYYLSELLKRYDGNLYYALAAYNAGEHRVDRWRKVLNTDDDDFFMENIEFEQTRKYVRGVMKYYWMYHLLVHPYEVAEESSDFPERSARDPWYQETGTFE